MSDERDPWAEIETYKTAILRLTSERADVVAHYEQLLAQAAEQIATLGAQREAIWDEGYNAHADQINSEQRWDTLNPYTFTNN